MQAAINVTANRRLAPALFAALLCSAASAATSARPPAPHRQPPPALHALLGKPAPDFALKDLNGRTWRLSEMRARKIVALQFASISCDCGQMAVYDLHELGRTFGARGVQVLAIGFEAQPLRPPEEFIRDSGLTVPFLTDPGFAAAKAYKVRWPPSVVIIDRAGKIHWACDEFHGDVLRRTRDVIERLLHADEAWNSNGGYGMLWSRGKPAAAAGVVTAVQEMSPLKGMSPGVMLTVRKGSRRASVLVGPAWFVQTHPVKIAPKDRVSVTGVSVLLRGKRVILAQQISRDKETIRLRDSNGQFPWTARANPPKQQSARLVVPPRSD